MSQSPYTNSSGAPNSQGLPPLDRPGTSSKRGPQSTPGSSAQTERPGTGPGNAGSSAKGEVVASAPKHRHKKRVGFCHPSIATPVVAILTLMLRVHPAVVCGIILLDPYGGHKPASDHWMTLYGPWVLFGQAFCLLLMVGCLVGAMWKESPALLLPFVFVQVIMCGIWIGLTTYALWMKEMTAAGVVVIAGFGAIFDAWSLSTILAAYIDVKNYRRELILHPSLHKILSKTLPPKEEKRLTSTTPSMVKMAHASGFRGRPVFEQKRQLSHVWEVDVDPASRRISMTSRHPIREPPTVRRRKLQQSSTIDLESAMAPRPPRKFMKKKPQLAKKPDLPPVAEA